MDSTYAPQSPDLSSFGPPPPPPPPPSQRPQPQPPPPPPQHHDYAPRSPVLPFASPSLPHPPHNFVPPSYMPPIPDLPTSHSFAPSSSHYAYNHNQSPTTHTFAQPPYQFIKHEAQHEARPVLPSFDPQQPQQPQQAANMSARPPRQPRSKPLEVKALPSPQTADFPSAAEIPLPDKRDPNPLNIEIKTKFPVARIKRIMQADEEVGKVAQVTPIAVSKALELFMIGLVSGAAAIAREKGGKRVTAQHLKAVVDNNVQFDFLADIVGKVQESTEGAGGETRKRKEKKKEGSESPEEGGEDKATKKRKGGRKKKAEEA